MVFGDFPERKTLPYVGVSGELGLFGIFPRIAVPGPKRSGPVREYYAREGSLAGAIQITGSCARKLT